MEVLRAELVGSPGRLVRVTRVSGAAAAQRTEDQVARWCEVAHPVLIPISHRTREPGGILLTSPSAAVRPLASTRWHTDARDPAVLASIGARIASGLQALHARGVVHGAVNDHTILLGPGSSILLDGPWHAGCPGSPRPDAVRLRRGPQRHTGRERHGREDLTVIDDTPTPLDDLRALAATLLAQLEGPSSPTGRPDRLDEVVAALTDPDDRVARISDRLRSRAPISPRQERPAAPARPPAAARAAEAPAPQPPGRRVTPLAGVRRRQLHRRSRLALVALAVTSIAATVTVAATAGHLASPTADRRGTTDRPDLAETAGSTTSPPAATEPPAPAPPPARPVCADTAPPPGPGRLVLADLAGVGCRAPVRIDGERLVVARPEARSVEVELDLEIGDQVRLGDLDADGRDEVLVYRPGTGELFRFPTLAEPGEVRHAEVQATGSRGGTATIVRSATGADRLEVRGGSTE
ncbi:MAG: hypothetical protein ACLFS9_07850 [Nitriliruptoraceae bacterium]